MQKFFKNIYFIISKCRANIFSHILAWIFIIMDSIVIAYYITDEISTANQLNRPYFYSIQSHMYYYFHIAEALAAIWAAFSIILTFIVIKLLRKSFTVKNNFLLHNPIYSTFWYIGLGLFIYLLIYFGSILVYTVIGKLRFYF